MYWLSHGHISWLLDGINLGAILKPWGPNYGFLISPCLTKQTRLQQQRCRPRVQPDADHADGASAGTSAAGSSRWLCWPPHAGIVLAATGCLGLQVRLPPVGCCRVTDLSSRWQGSDTKGHIKAHLSYRGQTFYIWVARNAFAASAMLLGGFWGSKSRFPSLLRCTPM